jgi:hypothetical protein
MVATPQRYRLDSHFANFLLPQSNAETSSEILLLRLMLGKYLPSVAHRLS